MDERGNVDMRSITVATAEGAGARSLRWILYVACLAVMSIPGGALAPGVVVAAASDLTEMSIEELMNIQVHSVSRKLQRVQDSAAAVFVITGEDIRRSGATSIPEALRMARGSMSPASTATSGPSRPADSTACSPTSCWC